MDITKLDENLTASFGHVRSDIDSLKAQISDIRKEIDALKAENTVLVENQKALISIIKGRVLGSGGISAADSKLSLAEKRIINFIRDNQNASYRDIADVLGNSPNTVKNHINNIEKKGIAIAQATDLDGRKRFAINA